MPAHRTRRPRRFALLVRALRQSLDRSGAILLLATAGVVLAVLLLVLAATPANAAETKSVNGDYSTGDARRLELDIPFGQLHVRGTDGSKVVVRVTATCEGADCDEFFKEFHLESSTRGATLRVKLDGATFRDSWNLDGDASSRGWSHSKHKGRGHVDRDADIEIVVEVPRSLEVDLNMGAGRIDIRDLSKGLSIDLGAGEIAVRMAAKNVGTVDVKMAVGGTTIHEGGRTREYARVLGGPVRWHDGKGDAGIDVNVGAGDVDVTLE